MLLVIVLRMSHTQQLTHNQKEYFAFYTHLCLKAADPMERFKQWDHHYDAHYRRENPHYDAAGTQRNPDPNTAWVLTHCSSCRCSYFEQQTLTQSSLI